MTRLAVGDAIGEIHSATIRVYDIERYSLQVAESCYHRAAKLYIIKWHMLTSQSSLYSVYLRNLPVDTFLEIRIF